MNDPNLERVKATLADADVVEVAGALAGVLAPLSERMEVVPIITAIAWTASSACKSFGLHPQEFARNFLAIYQATQSAEIVPPPLDGEAQS